MINVSWDDITGEYLPWLSRKAGKTYRLLTEAEWEYAARAGSTTRFHFGNDEKDLCTYGNAKVKQKKKDLTITNCRGFANTEPGGSFRPNAFGLYDMLGNVWEWVEDCRNENYSGAPRWLSGAARGLVVRQSLDLPLGQPHLEHLRRPQQPHRVPPGQDACTLSPFPFAS